jgi:hypothetical protein
MNNVISLEDRREKIRQDNLVHAVATNLGVSIEGLAEMLECDVDDVREGLVECLKRNLMWKHYYEKLKEREAAQDKDPNTCCNAVCLHYVQSEYEHIDPETGELTFSGREDYCSEEGAQGCAFRLLEPPPADPLVAVPSYNECVRILQRIGYIRPDSFGAHRGTDFSINMSTQRLWIAYVKLLVETDRVQLISEEMEQLEHLSKDDAVYCAASTDAKNYFHDAELPDNVVTIAELVAQRDALLQFIRGDLDWPDGRCPCGEDVHWDGVAHTPNCRMKDKHKT